MYSDIGSILYAFTDPVTIVAMVLAVFGGLLVGAIPGLTATMAVALLVPVTYGMTVELGLIILVAVFIGGINGGLIPATLLNIPGTPASIATTFDAYPMAVRGQAGKALAIGIFVSFLGGIFSFAALATLSPLLGSFALKFGPCEYFALVVFTLTCIISISRKSLAKGMIAGAMGMLMATVGLSDTDGVQRFTFDLDMLQSGFDIMPVMIGMFAIAQVLSEIACINDPMKVHSAKFNIRQFGEVAVLCLKSWKNVLRSCFIGITIGVLPGVGASLANVVAYSQTKAASKDPESFGQGNPDGIIASESANSASTGGDMVPLLTLGIPGDVVTMMMVGAFMIHGIQPGPLLMRDHSQLVAIIIFSYLISTCIMLVLQVACIRVFIRALTLPRHFMYPIVLVLCVIGSYALNSSMDDVWIFLGMGMLGVLMNKLDFPMLPLVLGLLLGTIAEREFRTGLVIGDNSLWYFMQQPISATFLVLSLLSVIYSLYTHHKAKKKGKSGDALGNQVGEGM